MKLVISILVAVWAAVAPISWAQEKAMVIEVGLLIDGTGGEPVKDAVIVIEGKKVKAVGKRGEVKIPQGAKVIQARDKMAFPGLIDSHVHLHKSWKIFLVAITSVSTGRLARCFVRA